MRRFSASDIVLKVLGLLLLTAAVLKGHELLTVPVANQDLWSWRPFLIFQVEFELALGIWLLSGVFKRLGWLVGLLCFGLFCGETCTTGRGCMALSVPARPRWRWVRRGRSGRWFTPFVTLSTSATSNAGTGRKRATHSANRPSVRTNARTFCQYHELLPKESAEGFSRDLALKVGKAGLNT